MSAQRALSNNFFPAVTSQTPIRIGGNESLRKCNEFCAACGGFGNRAACFWTCCFFLEKHGRRLCRRNPNRR
jgi:hypothetical protein